MAERFAVSGCKNAPCPKIYKDDQKVQNIMSGQLDNFSLQQYDVSELPSKFNGEMLTHAYVLSSVEEIVRLAGTRYVRGYANGGIESCFVTPALATEDQHGLELAHLLFISAEYINNKQYDQAARLLMQCHDFSSKWGSPIERVCYYFSRALQERIERQTCEELRNPVKPALNFVNNFYSGYNKAEFNQVLAFSYRAVPFVKLVQLTSVQAILDTVGNANKIHVIDLDIRNGSQWSGLIQSLALRSPSSSIKLLRITAIGMDAGDLKDSGRRLHELAKSLEVPFSYRMVQISTMEEIDEGMFNVKPGEAVAVFAPTVFHRLLYNRSLLESVIDVIKRLRPRIMVNIEVEADSNSPSFDKRFIDVLFHSSACFDAFDVIMPDRRDPERVKYEEIFCGSQIRNMIACEGNDRRVRHVKLDVWRCFFNHKGLKEMSFSYQAWYQARLLLKGLSHGECYSLEANGDALISGWKTTPLVAVSLWTCG
ncbi:hypothetical protein SUGI_0376080 [Cryptomeria japonica]|uniref:GRAS family protein RAM1-like n=1 Tax=Cryptomeria japonica TaxID=3369 RepID=UPI002408D91E|nr:GRAS family protein RAM1-like [Cryptomeria japonica]GLJ20656.1 hypothetical protein SUGI_0376080 [Cryptomeria japonica]